MEKVRLTLYHLQVQSFITTEREAGVRGTVRGHDAPTDYNECPSQDAFTCNGTCPDNSCGCETGECTVELECWYTDWGPCTFGGWGGPSDC